MATVKLDNTITLSFSVTDRDATAKWYEKHLGFEKLFGSDEDGWTELATNTPGVTIGLGDVMEASPGNSVPVFGTPDIDAARKALENEGIRFDGDTLEIAGLAKIATFFDPDNNALMLAQDLSGS